MYFSKTSELLIKVNLPGKTFKKFSWSFAFLPFLSHYVKTKLYFFSLSEKVIIQLIHSEYGTLRHVEFDCNSDSTSH